MNNNSLFYLGCIFFICTCRMPSDPLGIEIIQHIGPISTLGQCLDLDVNDSLLVASANFDGFIIFNLYDSNGALNPTQKYHGSNLHPNTANEQINKVITSI